jgi:hypothetical protein
VRTRDMVGRLVASATIADHAVAGDLCAAVPTIRLADVRICRNEYSNLCIFIHELEYSLLSSLSVKSLQLFPSFW